MRMAATAPTLRINPVEVSFSPIMRLNGPSPPVRYAFAAVQTRAPEAAPKISTQAVLPMPIRYMFVAAARKHAAAQEIRIY